MMIRNTKIPLPLIRILFGFLKKKILPLPYERMFKNVIASNAHEKLMVFKLPHL